MHCHPVGPLRVPCHAMPAVREAIGRRVRPVDELADCACLPFLVAIHLLLLLLDAPRTHGVFSAHATHPRDLARIGKLTALPAETVVSEHNLLFWRATRSVVGIPCDTAHARISVYIRRKRGWLLGGLETLFIKGSLARSFAPLRSDRH